MLIFYSNNFQPNVSSQYHSESAPTLTSPLHQDANHSNIMGKAPVVVNGATKKTKSTLNGGIPLFNHKNARDWIHKRAAYNKDD